MAKIIKDKKNSRINSPAWCPFVDGDCKGEDCVMLHHDFGKCNLELFVYNLFRVSQSVDNLLVELKKQ